MKAKAKAPKKAPKKRPAAKKKALRHDTPLDVPEDALATMSFNPRAAVDQALERVRRIETIQGAYEAWQIGRGYTPRTERESPGG